MVIGQYACADVYLNENADFHGGGFHLTLHFQPHLPLLTGTIVG